MQLDPKFNLNEVKKIKKESRAIESHREESSQKKGGDNKMISFHFSLPPLVSQLLLSTISPMPPPTLLNLSCLISPLPWSLFTLILSHRALLSQFLKSQLLVSPNLVSTPTSPLYLQPRHTPPTLFFI